MALARVEEIGPTYDLLIATRDGTTLACKNKDGNVVNLSQLAFMTSVSAQNQQHEETELQHKDQLVQLASSNLIDREFDQWPQVTQGDWSGGGLQRVLTGATPLTSFGAQSDPTRYWDGQGVLWPVTDYIPKRGVLATPDQHEAGGRMLSFGIGTVTGTLPLTATQGLTFAYVYQQQAAPQNNILVIQGDGIARTVTNPPGTVAAGNTTTFDMIVANDHILWLGPGAGTTVVLSQIDGSAVPVITTLVTIANASALGPGLLAAAQVGNKSYVAFLWFQTTTLTNFIRLIDLSGGSWTAAAVDIPLPADSVNVIAPTWTQIDFQGENIILAGTDFAGSFLMQYSITSQTWSTLARFTNSNNLFFCPIAGSLFVLSVFNGRTVTGMPDLVDAWLIQAGSAQHIGPIEIQSQDLGVTQGSYITGEGQPSVLGPYAIFPIYFFRNATTASYVAVMAYDVLRGRMFKMNELGPYDPDLLGDRRMAIISPIQHHPFASGTLPAQWGVAVPVLGGNGGTADITNVQRLLMNVTAPGLTFSPLIQQGVEITSSLIDFTSAQPKLFREVVVTWLQPGLPSDSAITVQVDVWLDQDPSVLNVTPDFTTGAVGSGVGGGVTGQTILRLIVNKIAKKMVYRVTTTGPSTLLTPAVKLISVVIRAATGWTRTNILDLADNVAINGNKNDMCWDRQSTPGTPAIDGTVAYNFLRQLWRLKGGEIAATFPNGDSTANWLLQDLHFDSPKPFGASMRADQKSSLGFISTVKMREDV